MNLYELAKETADVAAGNGFADPSWDNLPVKVMMAVTEVVEAEKSKHERLELVEELADIALRVLGVLNRLFGNDWAASRIEGRSAIRSFNVAYCPIEVSLWPVLSFLCQAVQDWRSTSVTDARTSLELSLLALWRLADALDLDLNAACAAKIEDNRGRGHLHGRQRKEA